MPIAFVLLLAALFTVAAADYPADAGSRPTPAADWPGLWGPTRSGALEEGFPAPPSRAREMWRRRVGGGYGEMAIFGEYGYTLELHDGRDFVVAVALDTGREQWRFPLGDTYRGHDGSHDGPISTPTVERDAVYSLSPHGRLVALDRHLGTPRWQVDLVADLGATAPAYGFGTAPLIESGLVVVQAGGEKAGGLMAFDERTGRRVWSALHGFKTGYASPVAATLAGTRQVVAAAGDALYGVHPTDGRLLWRVDGPGSGESVANSPIVLPGNRVLFSFWEDSRLIEVSGASGQFAAKEIWRSPRLRSAYGPVVHRDGSLYGFSGPFLLCLDAGTGEVRWRQRVYDGTLIGVGAHLLVLGRASGLLRVVDASPAGYNERMRATVFPAGATAMTGPSYSRGRVYVRNIDEVAAFALEH
jgi:outer membrane protein assembly factor BamB